MAHLQGNKPTDDSNKYGLKFDSEKSRWSLLPIEQVMNVVRMFNSDLLDIDIKKFHREDLINSIFSDISFYKKRTSQEKAKIMRAVAFKMFFLLRNKPYTKEELERSSYPFRWDLLDIKDLEGVVNVYTMGAKKYAPNNWQKVSEERYYDALIRHFNTIRTPNRYDSELGCLHAHQVIWNALSLMWLNSQIPEEILKAAKKIKQAPSIMIKPVKKKIVKKRVGKKK